MWRCSGAIFAEQRLVYTQEDGTKVDACLSFNFVNNTFKNNHANEAGGVLAWNFNDDQTYSPCAFCEADCFFSVSSCGRMVVFATLNARRPRYLTCAAGKHGGRLSAHHFHAAGCHDFRVFGSLAPGECDAASGRCSSGGGVQQRDVHRNRAHVHGL